MGRADRQRQAARRADPGHERGPVLWPIKQVGLVVLASAIIRVLYWLLFSRSPFFDQPVVDASFFDLWAQNLAFGHQAQPDVFFKPPLYPYLIAFLYEHWGRSLPVVYALQSLLGVGSGLLVLALGRLVFTPRIALTGAMVVALLPMLPFFELQLLAETLTTFLSLLALLLILIATRREALPSLIRLGLAGVLLGIAALGRPNLLLLPAVLAVWLYRLPVHGGGASARRAGWRAAGILLLGTVLAISPVTLRNARVGEALVPVCASFGVNLWTGHHAEADGTSPVPVGVAWDDLQLRCRQAGAGSAVASSRHLGNEALRMIVADPVRELGLLAKKIVVLCGAPEVRNNIGAAFLAREQGLFLLGRWWPGFWLMAPFACLGLVGARRWGRPGGLLWLYLLTVAVSVLPFFVNARFRAPMLPVLSLFAAAGVFGLQGELVKRRAGQPHALKRQLLLLLALFLAMNVDWFDLDRPAASARDHFNLAGIHAGTRSGRPVDAAGAERHFQRALELDDTDPDLPERYGQFLLMRALPFAQQAERHREQGRLRIASAMADSAARYLKRAQTLHSRAVALFPRSFRSHANLGTCHLWLGDRQALEASLAAAAGDSGRARVGTEAAASRYDLAGNSYRTALEINPRFGEAANNLQLGRERLLTLPASTAEVRRLQARWR